MFEYRERRWPFQKLKIIWVTQKNRQTRRWPFQKTKNNMSHTKKIANPKKRTTHPPQKSFDLTNEPHMRGKIDWTPQFHFYYNFRLDLFFFSPTQLCMRDFCHSLYESPIQRKNVPNRVISSKNWISPNIMFNINKIIVNIFK